MATLRTWRLKAGLALLLAMGCSDAARAPTCGDGVAAGQEVCDDGNTVSEAACAAGVAACTACSASCGEVLSLTGPVLALAGGDAQTGAAGWLLPEPLRVRVTNDGAAVPGVSVTWAIVAGGGSLSAAATTTDATGEAAVSWTIGTLAGAPQRVEAVAAGFAGPPVAFAATAVGGPPARLAFDVQPTTAMSTAAITPAPSVVALDAYGNVASSGVDVVSIALATNENGATLSGTTAVSPVDGVATFAGLAVDRMGAGYRLEARAAGLPMVSSDPFGVTAHLAFTGQPSETWVGEPIAPAAVVRATEAGVPLADLPVALALEGDGDAALGGTTGATTDATGAATFDALVLDRRGSGYRLVATAAPAGAPAATARSSQFDVLAVDQQQPSIDPDPPGVHAIGGPSQQKLAQVATVAEAGVVVGVRVPVVCGYGALTVEIRDVISGFPGGNVLASESFPATMLSTFAPTIGDYPLLRFATPAPFGAGEELALVIQASWSCVLEPGPTGDPYPGGDGFFDALPNAPGWNPLGNPRYDLPFQTIMR